MLVTEIMKKMIEFSKSNLHDINHFMKVYTWAKTIAEGEGVDTETLERIEITAIIHDIACPLCRTKYGSAPGDKQELESPALVRDFLEEFDMPYGTKERINFIVSHHHTYKNVDGIDWQIILEADYLVNADESSQPKDAIESFKENVFKTKTGLELLKMTYGV